MPNMKLFVTVLANYVQRGATPRNCCFSFPFFKMCNVKKKVAKQTYVWRWCCCASYQKLNFVACPLIRLRQTFCWQLLRHLPELKLWYTCAWHCGKFRERERETHRERGRGGELNGPCNSVSPEKNSSKQRRKEGRKKDVEKVV